MIDKIKSWFGKEENRVEYVVGGGEPVTVPPGGEDERETSTNAQSQGAAEEPWPGNS
jgi:hypothetical protein